MIRYLLASMVATLWGSGIVLVALAGVGIVRDRARDVRAAEGVRRTRGTRPDADVRTRSG